jgi:protein SCO1/2
LGEPAPAEEDDRASTVTEWLQPADRKTRFPAGYRFTDQDGHAKSSKALQGKPSVVSFFFTRCDNPNKCPLIVRTFGTLQSELKAAGIESLVNLALVTYDPLYDTPARLRRYADELGLRFNPTTVMLRSEPNEKNKLFEDLDVAVNFDSRGVNIHRIQLLLLDTQGRIARVYHSLIWDNPAVLRDLKTLLAEPAADSAALPTS